MGLKQGSGRPVVDHFYEEVPSASFHRKFISLERIASRYVGYLTLLTALALLIYAAVRIF